MELICYISFWWNIDLAASLKKVPFYKCTNFYWHVAMRWMVDGSEMSSGSSSRSSGCVVACCALCAATRREVFG